jgi:anti-sigma regulatory factor (Ser/Thr protein kinase)
VTLVIGDVVGRGVVAASVMAEMRTALRAYRMEGHELAVVAKLLNSLLTASGRSRSATLAVLELDLDTRGLAVVSAGHLPLLTVSPDAEARFLDYAQHGPIGVRPGERYSVQRYSFSPGSTLLLYTDGLVERRGESIDVGLERLRAASMVAATEPDGRFADRVYRRLASQTSVDDDVALLVVESLPLEPTLDLTLPALSSQLPELRRAIARWLASQGCGEDERSDIALAASEAASNAIEHAYGASEASFKVRAERDADVIRVVVSDMGRWRKSRPYGRGRGLTVMRGLMDSVTVDTDSSGTKVTLTKRLAAPGP